MGCRAGSRTWVVVALAAALVLPLASGGAEPDARERPWLWVRPCYLSPDGRKLALLEMGEDRSWLRVIEVPGGKTLWGSGEAEGDPIPEAGVGPAVSWAPDSQAVVWLAFRGRERNVVALTDVVRGATRRVPVGPAGWWPKAVCYAGAAERLLLLTAKHPWAAAGTGGEEVWALRLREPARHGLQRYGRCAAPWGRGGVGLMWMDEGRFGVALTNKGLYRVSLEPLAVEPLLPNPEALAVAAGARRDPDQRVIDFGTALGGAALWGTMAVTKDEGRARLVYRMRPPAWEAEFVAVMRAGQMPSPSPTGDRAALSMRDEPQVRRGHEHIWVVSEDGTARQLTTGPVRDHWPV